MTLQTTSATLALLGALVAITGCSSHMPGGAAVPTGTTTFTQPADHGRNHQGCQNDGGITVRPCSVRFDANHQGPVEVVVTRNGDGDRHAIRERDDCAARGIATVAKMSNQIYTVTAGASAGTCSARFSDDGMGRDDGGGRDGGSTLRIVNRL